MRFKRKNVCISLLTLLVFLCIIYNINMAPSGFQEDVDAFAIKVNSVLSYYEYTFYTLILLPFYLVFFVYIHEPVLQMLIRQKSKKKIALQEITHSFLSSLLFTGFVYGIGMIFPMICGVMSESFFISYTIQSFFMWLVFTIVSNIALIVMAFSRNLIFQMGVPFAIVMLYHVFRQRVFNIFLEMNVVIICFGENLPFSNCIILSISIAVLLIATIVLNLFVSSEKEYLDAR